MARSTFTVTHLATEAGIDVDEALIVLWDAGLEYINGPSSPVRRRDANRARRLVGLATRRELASKNSWQSLFDLDGTAFALLLESLDISTSSSRRFSKKDINKLRAQARAQGLSWVGIVDTQRAKPIPDKERKDHPDGVVAPFEWRIIGKERDIRYLTIGDIHAIHNELVLHFVNQDDPIDPPGVKSDSLLESAIMRPMTSIGQDKKYPTIEMAGAALLHSIVHNHPFHNGNKRTGLVSMLAFLDLNRLIVTCSEGEIFKTVLRIAQHAVATGNHLPDREVQFIAEWISKHSRPIELGDRPIPFRRLRKLLTRYDCTYSLPRANQITVTRAITRRRMLRRPQSATLNIQVPYRDEGREIDKNTIARIRKGLRLDEPNGIDSASFYDNAPAAAGEFIVQFRKTLRRLASL